MGIPGRRTQPGEKSASSLTPRAHFSLQKEDKDERRRGKMKTKVSLWWKGLVSHFPGILPKDAFFLPGTVPVM